MREGKLHSKPNSREIEYLGWSGFQIHQDDSMHIYVDPPKNTTFQTCEHLCVVITHGHPEHLGGTLDLLRYGALGKPRVTIMASKAVCRYLLKKAHPIDANFINTAKGNSHRLASNITIDVFSWRHMPLLPPGIVPAIRHAFQLLKGFRSAWRILNMARKGPKGAGPMLGYAIHMKGNRSIIVYGEGLHRKCRVKEVKQICSHIPAATLLVAAEPEDLAELPELIVATGASEAILYEPHRQWRDMFQLPHADLRALRNSITNIGISAQIAVPLSNPNRPKI